MPNVAHAKVKGNTKQAVLDAVKRAMELACWKKYVKGKSVFIKTNLLIKTVVPGQCTSPWVVEGVLKVLSENGFKIFIGDANVATARQVEKAAKKWGIMELCRKYGAEFVNLSKQPVEIVEAKGKIFHYLKFPKILTEVDSIITLPVLKTHLIPGMTCALKNQWGCIPTFRQQFHSVLNDAIPEINKALKVKFAVVDATVCMEGNGPVNGIPKIVNSIFASNDLVAVDAAAADFIGLGFRNLGYILRAEKLGVGSTKYKVIGDSLEKEKFVPAKIGAQPVVAVEMAIRKIPLIREIVFKTPLFKLPAFFASKYNTVYWYNVYGRKLRKGILKHPLYGQEFGELCRVSFHKH